MIARSAAVAGMVAVLGALAGCRGKPDDVRAARETPVHAATPRVANLHAFARLYGVVRWFHPGDAAAAADWDRLAIDGAHRVVDAPDTPALVASLRALFAPIAPTVRIAGPGEALTDDPALHPASTAGLDVVAWEHLGYGDSQVVSVYRSVRRHRPRSVPVDGSPFAGIAQLVDATPYRGAKIRLRAKVRVDGGGRGQLWMRVDRPAGVGFFDNMEARPARATTWTDAEIVGTVDADATAIAFGGLIHTDGTAWFDDLELAVEAKPGAWRSIAIADPGFESADPLTAWHLAGNQEAGRVPGWTVIADRDQRSGGAASMRIAREMTTADGDLFDDAPAPGETVDVDLGAGVRARVPIALYSKDGHTLGDDRAPAPAAAVAPAPAGFDPIAGAADVIVAWNALEHFWPYWDVVAVDWNAELDLALADALDDRGADDHLATLERLSAAAPDGHAHAACPGTSAVGSPPFALDWIEDRVVVVASTDDRVRPGDVVVSIDGRAAADALTAAEARISGSPQWRRVNALAALGDGAAGSTAHVRLRRDAAELDVELARSVHEPLATTPAHAAIERLAGGVWYVDLSRVTTEELDAALGKLAAAPGVVFDLRGYPSPTPRFLSHLLSRADDSTAWMAVAHVIRPDHAAPVTWTTMGWSLPAVAPHVGGKVAFLTGPGAISYAESVMGLVDHYHLGAIVGAPTAGTNGNIASIAEPTGCQTLFTGMRVTRHDGTRHHLLGVQPTEPAARTIAGVRAGRDEVLDAALAVVRAP